LQHHANAEDATDKGTPTAPRHDANCNDNQTLTETTAKHLLKQRRKMKLQHRTTTYCTKSKTTNATMTKHLLKQSAKTPRTPTAPKKEHENY
jgi:hypothetical protein